MAGGVNPKNVGEVGRQGVNAGCPGVSEGPVELSLGSGKCAQTKGTFVCLCCVYAGIGQV